MSGCKHRANHDVLLHCSFTFFALAFFSYVSDRGFFFGCSVALEKKSSNSLVLTMFGSFKEPHSVLLLQNRKKKKKRFIPFNHSMLRL